jgi:hypothetical protein
MANDLEINDSQKIIYNYNRSMSINLITQSLQTNLNIRSGADSVRIFQNLDLFMSILTITTGFADLDAYFE